MKDSIQSVIGIDNKTKDLVAKTDQEIEEIRLNTRAKLSKLEADTMFDAKETAQVEFDRITNYYNGKAKELVDSNKKRLDSIDGYYKDNLSNLIDGAVKIFFTKGDE